MASFDELKIAHKNLNVREGAKRAITRIRGWREQARRAGDALNDGTVVDGSISVQSLHIEPDMKSSLSWLDPSVADVTALSVHRGTVARPHPPTRGGHAAAKVDHDRAAKPGPRTGREWISTAPRGGSRGRRR